MATLDSLFAKAKAKQTPAPTAPAAKPALPAAAEKPIAPPATVSKPAAANAMVPAAEISAAVVAAMEAVVLGSISPVHLKSGNDDVITVTDESAGEEEADKGNDAVFGEDDTAEDKNESGKRKMKRERKAWKLTGYLLFSKEVDKQFANAGHKMNFAQRGKYLSEQWKALPAEQKSQWNSLAEKASASMQPKVKKPKMRTANAFILFSNDAKQKLAHGGGKQLAEVSKYLSQQWAAMPPEEKKKWKDLAEQEKEAFQAKRLSQGADSEPAHKQPGSEKTDKPKEEKKSPKKEEKEPKEEKKADVLMEELLRRREAEKEKKQKKKEEKQLARQQLQHEKKEHGLEDMTLPHASTPPPHSHPIRCEYPEHFGQLLVIYSMLNAFGELLNLKPLQYNDLEMALKESSVLWEEIHLTLLKFLTQETDTKSAVPTEATPEEGDEQAPRSTSSATPFSLATVLRFTWASHHNWPEVARKYLLAQNENDLAAAFGAKEYTAISEADKIALLEFLCNEFMTKSVAFRKYLDEGAAKLEELRKEKWQEIMADRQAKKKEKEEAAQSAPAAEEPEPEPEPLDRKAAAKKRKAEKEAQREQRRAADEQRKQQKIKEQRRAQMNVIRGQLRASVCIGLDRSRRRYWLFGIGALDWRLMVEDPNTKVWSTYETPEEFEALLKWLNKNGVRERKLLKKLQKNKGDILEKLRSGPLQLFQERKVAVSTRSEVAAVTSTPLDEARKQLLELQSSIPPHGLGGSAKGWTAWEEEAKNAANIPALIPPLITLEATLVPDTNIFIPFWTGALARAWRDELTALRDGKEAFTTSKFFLHLEVLQYAIKRQGKDEIADKKCNTCRSSENDEKMLLCDRCDAGYHIFCLKPPLKTIPQDDWFCARCRASNAVLRSNGRRSTRRSPR